MFWGPSLQPGDGSLNLEEFAKLANSPKLKPLLAAEAWAPGVTVEASIYLHIHMHVHMWVHMVLHLISQTRFSETRIQDS